MDSTSIVFIDITNLSTGRLTIYFLLSIRLTASSSNSSPWRQDSSFSALSVLEITYSGNLLTRIGNQASFKSSSSFKSGLKLEKTVSLLSITLVGRSIIPCRE